MTTYPAVTSEGTEYTAPLGSTTQNPSNDKVTRDAVRRQRTALTTNSYPSRSTASLASAKTVVESLGLVNPTSAITVGPRIVHSAGGAWSLSESSRGWRCR